MSPGGDEWASQERKFDAIMQAYMKERRIPGACVAVSLHGRQLLNKGNCCRRRWNVVQTLLLGRVN